MNLDKFCHLSISPEWLTAWGTVVLAVITGSLAYFTLKLWRSTSDLVKGSDESAKKELRAYISLKPQDIRLTVIQGLFQVNIYFKNVGKTPAKNVSRAISMEIRDKNEKIPFIAPLPLPGKQTMAPGSKWYFRRDLNICDGDLMLLQKTEKIIYVWGRAEYTDIFEVSHSIDFRYKNGEVAWEQTDGVAKLKAWILTPEDEGNDAT